MAMLTAEALDGLRKYIKRTVSYGRYKIGGTWTETPLTDVNIDASGVVRIAFVCAPNSAGTRVTEVQLYDNAGQLWADKTVSHDMGNVTSGYYELFKITLKEESA